MAYHRPIPHPITRQHAIGGAPDEDRMSVRRRLAIIAGLSLALWLAIALAILAAIG